MKIKKEVKKSIYINCYYYEYDEIILFVQIIYYLSILSKVIVNSIIAIDIVVVIVFNKGIVLFVREVLTIVSVIVVRIIVVHIIINPLTLYHYVTIQQHPPIIIIIIVTLIITTIPLQQVIPTPKRFLLMIRINTRVRQLSALVHKLA